MQSTRQVWCSIVYLKRILIYIGQIFRTIPNVEVIRDISESTKEIYGLCL